jgi:AcrR family transcriptional regulator
LFSQQGTRSVGVDTIIEQSGVAKTTLYRHFPSKQELVIAFMERREELWTFDWLRSEVQKRADKPRDRLLAIFDVFNEWFNTDRFEGCSFINVLLEYQAQDPLHEVAAAHLARIRGFLKELASEAGIADVPSFANTWHVLMKGSIVAACEGNRAAAIETKRAAKMVLDCWPKA